MTDLLKFCPPKLNREGRRAVLTRRFWKEGWPLTLAEWEEDEVLGESGVGRSSGSPLG